MYSGCNLKHMCSKPQSSLSNGALKGTVNKQCSAQGEKKENHLMFRENYSLNYYIYKF